MGYRRRTHLALFVLSLLLCPLSARATNGYWAHGYGANPNTGTQTGSLEMNQNEVEIGVGFPF